MGPETSQQVEAHLLRASNLLSAGESVAAIEALAALIQQQPDHFAAYRQLGALQRSLGDLHAAKAWYLLALERTSSPAGTSLPGILIELGLLCADLGQPQEASAHLRGALASAHLDAGEALQLGAGLARLGQLAPAIEALSGSLTLQPSASAWTELGHCQFRLREPVLAEASYRAALRVDSEYAPAHANLGLVLLLRGEYPQGFAELEWRLKLNHAYHLEGFQAPRWNGQPLEGKTILLHAEQGFGDTLQFLRFVPLVADRGARVLLVVQPALHRLAATYPGVSACVSLGIPLPPLDFHCPLMSLPLVLGTTLQSIPSFDPLALQPGLASGSAGIPQANRSGPLRVGLVWAGNPAHLTDADRSVPLASLGELAMLDDAVAFISLQHGSAARLLTEESPSRPTFPLKIQDACSGVKDFAETAQQVAGLDLILTVDTAVAHLAGSMGKPVWVLLGSTPEWRWGWSGETTPWYPNLRLFRVQQAGDWTQLMANVAAELRVLADAHLTQPTCCSAG